MSRPKHPRDLETTATLCARYSVPDSSLRLWVRSKEIRGFGKRPMRVSEAALVKLLKSKGRPHEPVDGSDASQADADDDPLLTLAQVADLLGVEKQTASGYKSLGRLRSYRRSDVIAYRDDRDGKATRQNSGLAFQRERKERLQADRIERESRREAGELYEAAHVDKAAEELGRMLARHRQQGAQRITAVVAQTIGDHGVSMDGELRAALTAAVGHVLDEQGRQVASAIQALLQSID